MKPSVKEIRDAIYIKPDPLNFKCPIYEEMKRLVTEAESLPSMSHFWNKDYVKMCDCVGLSSGWRIVGKDGEKEWTRLACDSCDTPHGFKE